MHDLANVNNGSGIGGKMVAVAMAMALIKMVVVAMAVVLMKMVAGLCRMGLRNQIKWWVG